MSVSLENPSYRRTTPLPQGYLESLGIKAGSPASSFFAQFDGPFCSQNTGFTLLALGDKNSRECIEFATAIAREKFGWPERYLVISDLLGNAVLVYDTVSEGVFNVDFEGGESLLFAGKLPAEFVSFQAFIEWFFAGDC